LPDLGDPGALPFLAKQERSIFRRAGLTDPLSIEDHKASGGWAGLAQALALGPTATVNTIVTSGLRGRGGAGFPAGIKWRTVAGTSGPKKYIVCNADEGDSGTFADRMAIEGDPYALIEGMVIAGFAVGADEGIVYLRSEYPLAIKVLRKAISHAEAAGLLGPHALGPGRAFKLSVFVGAGAYICGEETSLLESLEGKRAQVRAKPPIPARSGLHGKPTLVHNVLSLCSVPDILVNGAEWYQALGLGRSTGTQPFQLAGNVKRGGLIELPFGVTIRTLVEEYGSGTKSGRPLRAVQVGGPLGAYLPDHLLDTRLTYEDMAAIGGGVGHGGLVVFDDTVDLLDQARFAFEFCAFESCGKCTPCRIGSTRGRETLDRLRIGDGNAAALIADLCETMTDGSLCALGGMIPIPVRSAMQHFPEDFNGAPLRASA
jgi:formate dehydrogenase iron-sulfur subunit